MTLPLKVQSMVKDIISYLDPAQNYSRKIKFYHNDIIIEENKLILSGDLHIFGAGKAASFEVKSIKDLIYSSNLEVNIKQAVSLTKEGHTLQDKEIIQLEGTHPVVTKQNILQTKKFISYLKNIQENDTVLFMLSGGASALLELPIKKLSFEQLEIKHRALLSSGLNINEMNKQRKALSQVKDGGLLNFIKSNNIIQLITCDIPNEKLSDVSSGPLLPDPPSARVRTFMVQGASQLLEYLEQEKGFKNLGIYDCLMDDLIQKEINLLPRSGEVTVSGGEGTLVIPKDPGKGGRNTHYVLELATKIYKNQENLDIHILSLGTDGTDGPTDAAGAYINFELYSSLNSERYLKEFDSYTYFEKLGTLIKTGPTKTNVMDIRIMWNE
jgi:hydroxypyruvate reductase